MSANPSNPSNPVVGLTSEQKGYLLQVARGNLEACVRRKPLPKPSNQDATLQQPRGCFVTLTIGGDLRGCIGYVRAVQPLVQAVGIMACQAALHDPRFEPVQPDELPGIRIEISVLSPMQKIADPLEVRVGEHGLMVQRSGRSGLLLPQVATEYGWDRETFLDQTCVKAGLSPGDWRRGSDLYVFSAEIFGDAD